MFGEIKSKDLETSCVVLCTCYIKQYSHTHNKDEKENAI